MPIPPTSQTVRYTDPVPRIITQPLGDVPSYYRRVNSKSDLETADFEAGSTVLGWLEMFHAYSGRPESKEHFETMHEYANKVFGDGEAQTISFELDFAADPKRMTIQTSEAFDFQACEQVMVGTNLNTECETTIGDMAVILDEVAGQLTEFAQADADAVPYITHVALGFNIQPAQTTIGVRVGFNPDQRPSDATDLPNASYCTAMRALGRDVDITETDDNE